ncbi:MAG: transketolase [Spirochaetae bacterium HGW-Spirochaetae-7]|nr:MAG: transketolase [Spirochaetae bacterium HGW-Spirochaetae-7]
MPVGRIASLEAHARDIRREIVSMVHAAQSGHCGGSLSSADIVAALYFDILNIDPARPRMAGRDRFVLSKGHACPVLYAALALRGYLPVEELSTLRRNSSRLQGHPVAPYLPGIDATTGSLGMGFGQAVGMALEAKMTGAGHTVYTLLGDGELDEGLVWEAAASAAKFKLDNLVAIIDRNNLQNDGYADDIMPMEPIDRKFEAFNWRVIKIEGHDMSAIVTALESARTRSGKPTCIIAHTVKGKGVSFMEDRREWHGKAPSDEEKAKACAEIAGGRS